jgi:hypothetical protein
MAAIMFMPWANISEAISFGRVRFVSWEEAKVLIPSKLRSDADGLFSRFFDFEGKVISPPTVCQFNGKTIFSKIEQSDVDSIRDAINALTFTTIAPGTIDAVAKNNKTPNLSSADRFSPWLCSLHGNGTVQFKWSDIVHTYTDKLLYVRQPFHVLVGTDKPNEHVLSNMQSLFTLAEQGQECALKIIRSLEWFKSSQTKSTDLTFRSKLVMLMTAFEILLDFPRSKVKSSYFAKRIDKYRSTSKKDLEDEITIDGKQLIVSRKAVWAQNLYQMRNKIVHGDYVAAKDIWYESPRCTFVLNYDLIASILFNECVARELLNLNLKQSFDHQPWDEAHYVANWLA